MFMYFQSCLITMGGCISENSLRCPRCRQIIEPRTFHNCTYGPENSSSVGHPRPKGSKMSDLNAQISRTPFFIAFLKPVFPPTPDKFASALYKGGARVANNDQIYVKKPIDAERTVFEWEKQQVVIYPLFIKNFPKDLIRKRTFQEKMMWFRVNIETLRVPWQEGCEILEINRSQVLLSSKTGLKKVNLRKQLKIKFNDEKVDDAGGLLREWMHLVIKQLFNEKIGIFELCHTDETAYKFVWDSNVNESHLATFIETLGAIIGKALFERISLNCFLNRTIWRQVSGFTVFLHDAYSFDKELHRSWKSILEAQGAEELELYFSELRTGKNKKTEQIQIVQGGKNIKLTDQNKDQYIFQMIQLYCTRGVSLYINSLKEGIYRVIPPDLLSVFEPHEIEMLLNGPQVIDVQDWKNNTLYIQYNGNNKVIQWFWKEVFKYNQKKLGNLLHYCTGSNRVPILGFRYLESNRNKINRFTIKRVELQKDNPYPRSYTCFNRLQLPEYPSQKQLKQKLNVVASQEISHFGLD